MPSVSLSGHDVIQIDGRRLNDLAEGDPVAFTFPNDIATVKAGKNGNAIFAANAMGRIGELVVRVLLGTADDKYLNSRLQQWFQDSSGFTLLTATFTKRVGDGQGNINFDVYQAINGVFKKQPDTKTSAEGDAEQSVAVYTMTFASVAKSIQ